MNRNTQTITIYNPCKTKDRDSWIMKVNFWTGVEKGKPYLEVIDYQHEHCKAFLFTSMAMFKLYYEEAMKYDEYEQSSLISYYAQNNVFGKGTDEDIAYYFSENGEEGLEEFNDKTLEWITAMFENEVPDIPCADTQQFK